MHRSRRLTLALLLSLASAPLLSAVTYYTQSPVTLDLTLHTTSAPSVTEPDADGLVVTETTIETRRLDNATLLQEMAQRSLIPSARGHSVVAVWANWPDEKPFQGSAFRLFVRRAGAPRAALTRVPHELFGITPEDWLHEKDLLRRSGVLKAGHSDFEAYTKLDFSFGGTSGTLLGRDTGGGRFRAPAPSRGLQYLPEPGTLSVEGTAASGLCSGEISFGQARFIPASDFKAGALPQKTRPGESYGVYSVDAGVLRVGGAFTWFRAPYVHYFCPLEISMTLQWEEPVPSTQKGRTRTRIASATVPPADLLRGVLADYGVTDPEGWAFYLHDESDEYTSLTQMNLVVAHPDGRIFQLSDPSLTLSSARAEQARREHLQGTYVSGNISELAHLTHDRSWPLPGGTSLSVLATGLADIDSRYGAIPEATDARFTQPVAAEAELFGTYSKPGQNGLVNITFSLGAPLAQTELPAAWRQHFQPYLDTISIVWGELVSPPAAQGTLSSLSSSMLIQRPIFPREREAPPPPSGSASSLVQDQRLPREATPY